MRDAYDVTTREGKALSVLLFALGEKGRSVMRGHFLDLAAQGDDDARETLNVMNAFERARDHIIRERVPAEERER